MISIVYFGTRDFAASILEALFKSGQFDIKAVITQPDRPAGRHQEVLKPPVKLIAEKYGAQILQPDSLKNYKLGISNIKLSIVCEYGLIVPQVLLDEPELGTLNVHYSMLPKYRGASPIQSALINGEVKTGVTIMLMDKDLDHGPILAQKEINIFPDDTYQSLGDRISPVASDLLINTCVGFVDGEMMQKPQNDVEATFCKLFTRDDGMVDWSKSAADIYNLYRGLTPWPGIWTTWKGKRLKFQEIKPPPPGGVPLRREKQKSNPGLVSLSGGSFIVACGDGAVEIIELQLEGSKVMPAKAFAGGHNDFVGSRLL